MIHIHSLGRAARYFPERMALVSNARRSTFRELRARVARIAGALTRHGFKAGDRLAILLPNEPDYIELVYACAWLGVVAVPLNTRLSAVEINRVLTDANPRGLIRHSSLPVPTVHVRRACCWRLSGHCSKVQSAKLLRDGPARTRHAHGAGANHDQYVDPIPGSKELRPNEPQAFGLRWIPNATR